MENFNEDSGNVECIPSIRNEDNVKLEDVRVNQHVPENQKRAVTKSKGSKMKNRIIVVVNTIGGVGKSTLAIQIIPMLIPFGKEICIDVYSIDDHRSCELKNTKALNMRTLKTSEAGEALLDTMYKQIIQAKNGSDNIYSIIEAGGSQNTDVILGLLESKEMDDNISYVIPVISDVSDFENMLSAIRRIRGFHKKSKIFVALNKAKKIDKESVEKQFIAFYGNKDAEMLPRIKEIEKDVTAIIPIPELTCIFEARDIRQVSLRDLLPEAEETSANISQLRDEWAKLGKEEFIKREYWQRCLGEILEFRDAIAPLGKFFE